MKTKPTGSQNLARQSETPSPATNTKAAPLATTSEDAPGRTFEDSTFGGTHKSTPDHPVPTTTGPALPLQARLKEEQPVAAAAVIASILPENAIAADVHACPSIADALAHATDSELMALLSTKFQAREKESEAAGRPPLKLGVQFVDVGRLQPGQTRISIDRVREKVAKQVTLGGFSSTTESPNAAVPSFGDQTATVPLSAPKPAIAGPNGRVLVIDGNHQAVASILAGAKQTPIDIVADHQHLSEAEFSALADKEGWTYLNEFGGVPAATAPSYGTLKNDPLRFVLSEVAFKASAPSGDVVFEETEQPASRAWVKLAGKTVDFVEFILADILYRSSDADPKLGKALETSDVDARGHVIRTALQEAAGRGEVDPAALGIMLLDAPVVEMIDLAALKVEVAHVLDSSSEV